MLRAAVPSSHPAMVLQGPFVVVADSVASDVVAPLRESGAFPIIETSWADAPNALASVEPEAIVLAEPCPDPAQAEALTEALAAAREKAGGLYTPVIARTRDDAPPMLPEALAIAASAPPGRLVRRLSTALRARTLHGTVLRRT